MGVIGFGIDVVEIDRIAAMLAEHGDRFAQRVFTEGERSYADAGRRRRAERYAARFACKEAVLKALGTGWRDGIAWTDIEVRLEPSGRPFLRLAGRCAEIADAAGIARWQVSLSHTERYAVAGAIGSAAASA
ncbi:MAG: holo-ACP synthase [Planctomycetota bacterium]|jgi:holo-[acyl-carrier protein] synthase